MQNENKIDMILEAVTNMKKSIDILSTKVDRLEKYIIPKRNWQIATISIIAGLVAMLVTYLL
ncbi:hypothetical protein SAMN05443428_1165 [Caloramator quimbayensis]|uniref:Haemolysin XhlA n=1 Tax=Caloramator quimbayensis TaxID=1147123 RepID=A0A1T4XXY1_9CLOT|nr:hypothetical protein [Caloramator quimbayensis]SKA94432.1 hypothetical protein SAMN05443428_1165 [Caloramator quimbayensis]